MNTSAEIVFVVDDDPSIRTAMRRLLKSAGFRAELFESAEHYLSREPHPGPGCLVLDVRMPGMSGISLHERLQSEGTALPIVFLTGHGSIPMSVEAMKRGAFEFLTKPVDDEVLIEAVKGALSHHRNALAEESATRIARARLGRLTPREFDVLRCVIAGASNKQTGELLGIAERTVKIHRGRVMRKLGAKNLVELVALASRAGVEPRTLPSADSSGSHT